MARRKAAIPTITLGELQKLVGKRLEEPHAGWRPIPLYGERGRRTVFPVVGDVIREDGLIYVLRRADRSLSSPPNLTDDILYYSTAGLHVVA